MANAEGRLRASGGYRPHGQHSATPPYPAIDAPALQRIRYVPVHIRTTWEVERLAKLPTVVQAPGDGRQIFQADADMARLFLEDGTALILSQSPPRLRLANGNKRGLRRLRTRKSLLACDQGVSLGTVGVARVARNTTQNPGGFPRCRRLGPFENR